MFVYTQQRSNSTENKCVERGRKIDRSDKNNLKETITIGDTIIEDVDQFYYLGSIFEANGEMRIEKIYPEDQQ